MKKTSSKQLSNQLRIIGGKWRGRKLQFESIDGLRPTGDRIRETLFNWLAPYLAGAHCLDLYSGSGALAFEALSRGAEHLVAIDKYPRTTEQLEKSRTLLDAENLDIINIDCLNWLREYDVENYGHQGFDIIFVDPPFNSNLINKTISAITASTASKVGTLIYVEAAKNQTLPSSERLSLQRHKIAGEVQYSLYEVLAVQ